VRLREEDLRAVNRELEGTRTQRMSQGESVKQCNERWEKACGEMREEYEQEIKELRNKVKFLINKLESMQEGDRQNMGEMVQSKMMQSSASIDSCRFTPNSSVSSKEPSTRRNTSGMKPAQAVGRMGKSHPLGERNF
jgi:chromosome segregation ATPase